MVSGLQLADHPALQVGERLVDERAPVSPVEYGEPARVPFSGWRGWVNLRAMSS
jgi:hypothetical protein